MEIHCRADNGVACLPIGHVQLVDWTQLDTWWSAGICTYEGSQGQPQLLLPGCEHQSCGVWRWTQNSWRARLHVDQRVSWSCWGYWQACRRPERDRAVCCMEFWDGVLGCGPYRSFPKSCARTWGIVCEIYHQWVFFLIGVPGNMWWHAGLRAWVWIYC